MAPADLRMEQASTRACSQRFGLAMLSGRENSRPDNIASPNLWEQALVDACSILKSAGAMAYDHADNLTGSNRKVAMGMVHLIELAQHRVDSVLEEKLEGYQA